MIPSWLDVECQELFLARSISCHYHIFLRLPSQEVSIFIINVSCIALREYSFLPHFSIKIDFSELRIGWGQAKDVLSRTPSIWGLVTNEALREPNLDVTYGLNLEVEACPHILRAYPVGVPESATRLAGKARIVVLVTLNYFDRRWVSRRCLFSLLKKYFWLFNRWRTW